MILLISPFSKSLNNSKAINAKNYPHWAELIVLLKAQGHEIIQVGTSTEQKLTDDCRFDLPLMHLRMLLHQVDLFISVDNFFPHFAHYYGKRGIVIFSKSDPLIFGYPENINLLRDRHRLRPDQFGLWESCKFDLNSFVEPVIVVKAVAEFKPNNIHPITVIAYNPLTDVTPPLPAGYQRIS